MTSDVPEQDAPRRRTAIWLAVGAVVLIVAVIVAVLLTRGESSGAAPGSDQSYNGSAPASPGSGSPSTQDSAPVPSPSVPKPTATGKPTVVPTKATASTTAPLDQTASLGNGVSVRVAKVESVKGEAQGPGEIAGPAVRVTVEVANGTDKEVPMDLALVNLYYGEDKTPASTLSGPGVAPLSAPIAVGKTDSGTYVFSVPESQRGALTVEFSYTTDAPTVIFRGKA
ncbi:MAG TPA: hypothetical protein VFP34_11255 [Microlunatus sp.]|nr:hypothetical protein [Microlunatus sp.]